MRAQSSVTRAGKVDSSCRKRIASRARARVRASSATRLTTTRCRSASRPGTSQRDDRLDAETRRHRGELVLPDSGPSSRARRRPGASRWPPQPSISAEARERARGDAVERAFDVLDAALGDAHALELEPAHGLAQEARLLAVRIDQQDLALGRRDRERNAGQARRRCRDRRASRRATYGRIASESSRWRVTISAGIAHGGQVVGGVPAFEQIDVVEQALDRRVIERECRARKGRQRGVAAAIRGRPWKNLRWAQRAMRGAAVSGRTRPDVTASRRLS